MPENRKIMAAMIAGGIVTVHGLDPAAIAERSLAIADEIIRLADSVDPAADSVDQVAQPVPAL